VKYDESILPILTGETPRIDCPPANSRNIDVCHALAMRQMPMAAFSERSIVLHLALAADVLLRS
jgi:hypothetical protein